VIVMSTNRGSALSKSLPAVAISLFLLMSTFQSPVAAAETVPFADEFSSPARPGEPVRVLENYEKLSNDLFLHEPDLWGGAYVDGTVLVVKAVGRSVSAARSILQSVGITQGISVVPGTRSIRQLDELANSALEAAVSEVVQVGPQYSTSKVVIGMTKDNPNYRSFLASLNRDAFAVFRSAPARQTSRYFDTSPFYGGARIRLSSTSSTAAVSCSSGFSWNAPNSTAQMMVTAGHCYASTSSLYPLVSRYTTSGWTQIGNVVWSSAGAGGTVAGRNGDLSVYSLTSGLTSTNRVYVGTYDTTASRQVVGSVSLPEGWKGTSVYTSGAGPAGGNGSGEVLLDWISLVNQTINYSNGQTYTKLSVGENASTCVGSGDSGGAVYQVSGSSNALAVGIISGSNNHGILFTNCRSYFTPIGILVSDYGGSLKTTP